MSDQAQPTAAQVQAATAPATPESAPAAAENNIVAQNGRTVGEKPAPFRAKTVGSAMERARAALEARAASAKAAEPKGKETPKASEAAKSGEAPRAESKTSNQEAVAKAIADAGKVEPKTEAKADEPTKEPAKVEEKEKAGKLARGLAILAEREARVRQIEQNAKRMMADIEAKQAAATSDPDLQFAKQIREAKAKGPGAVMQLLGIDLRAGVEEMAKTYEEPTPDALARKAAVEEFNRLQREAKEQADREKAQAEEKAQAQLQVTRTSFADDVRTEFVRAVDDFPYVAENSVSDFQVADFALQQEKATGRRPTAVEALRAIEKILADAAEKASARKAAKAKAAEATQKAQVSPPPAPPPPKAEAKPEPTKQEASPAEPRSRKESEFKPRPMRVSKDASAIERARAAMANRHLS